MTPEGEEPTVTYLESLTGHAKAVNALRFSPGGTRLASGADQGELFLWRPTKPDGSEWRQSASLRGHQDDVQDIAWAPDGSALASGSVENRIIVWDTSSSGKVASTPATGNRACEKGFLTVPSILFPDTQAGLPAHWPIAWP